MRELSFVVVWSAAIIVLRWQDGAHALGELILGSGR
jgi:hypothetical protein